MSDLMVLEDVIDAEWWRQLHVMAGSDGALLPYKERVPSWGTVKMRPDEMRLHHLKATWPAREPISLRVPLGVWPMVAWWIGDDRVSQAMIDGGEAFALAFGMDPGYAFIRRIPAKAHEFVEVGGITLVRADWVPEHFIAVARGGMQQFDKVW